MNEIGYSTEPSTRANCDRTCAFPKVSSTLDKNYKKIIADEHFVHAEQDNAVPELVLMTILNLLITHIAVL